MKANELMIGDWVCVTKNFTQKYHKIRALSNDEGAVFRGIYVNEYGVKNPSIFSPNDTEPIPLTKEILEKNGFKRNPLWHHCDKDLDDYSISVQLGYANRIEYVKIAEKGKDNVIPSERTKLYLTHIKYVHELQHVLRLCRINMIIEL